MNEQASTAAGSAAGAITVEVIARPPHTSFLVVTYDGLEPPRALFADLEMIGWVPPVLAPPPRSAIDWSTPNEATGETFTVRSWKVEGAIVEPPAGSGPRGSWNPHEGDAFLRAMRGVLQRHGVQPLDADGRMRNAPPPPAAAPAPPNGSTIAPPPPAPAVTADPDKKRSGLRGFSSKLREAADGVGAPSRATTSAKAAASADASVELLTLVLSIPEDGKLAIRGTAAPARFPAIEDGLLALGVDVWFTTEEQEERQTFRGSSVSTTVMKFKVTALADPAVAADAVTVFDEQGAKVEVEVLDAEQAQAVARAADLETGATEDEDEDEEFAMVQLRYPCVHLVVEPMRAEGVIELIHRLGLQFARKRPAELESVGVFRGSKHVTSKPAIAFDVWAPPAHATRVLQELASVGGVDPERQPDQVWIEPPPDAPGAERAADAAETARPSGIPSVEIAHVADPKASREIVSDTEVEPLDIERDLAGLIEGHADLVHVTQRSGSGDEVLTHR